MVVFLAPFAMVVYPWDDDMDIVMMRDQYELLMEHFNEWRTTERFKLVSYRDKSSIYQFAKNSGYYHGRLRDFCGEKKASTGVWVDIFPWNITAINHFLLKKHRRVGLVRSFAVTDPTTGSNVLIKLIKHMVCPL